MKSLNSFIRNVPTILSWLSYKRYGPFAGLVFMSQLFIVSLLITLTLKVSQDHAVQIDIKTRIQKECENGAKGWQASKASHCYCVRNKEKCRT